MLILEQLEKKYGSELARVYHHELHRKRRPRELRKLFRKTPTVPFKHILAEIEEMQRKYDKRS
ncbi:MAG TPA: hypothetical protein PLN21_07745 [Gemmatales bacterium]|nr:hypothetical protein [Gemmatales bacterium]